MSEKIYNYTKITDLKDMLKKSGKEYGKKIAYQIKKEELIESIGGIEMIKYDLSMRKAMEILKK